MSGSTSSLALRCRLRSQQIPLLFAVPTLVLLLASTPLLAATLQVPADYSTIQAAIDAASVGDTVRVAAGTYNEAVFWVSKPLTLLGEGADRTTIDATGKGPTACKTYGDGGAMHIEGFTFRGGRSTDWFPGGLSVGIYDLTLVNCILEDNVGVHGGGCSFGPGRLVAVGNIFRGNQGGRGGGIHIKTSDPVLLRRNIIENNAAVPSALGAGAGGGVYIGVYEGAPPPTVIVEGNTIRNNSATDEAGALRASPAMVALRLNTVTGNSAPTAGAVWLGLCAGEFDGNLITFNVTTASGSGAVAFPSPATGILSFTSNTVANNEGGGLVAHSLVHIMNSILWGNTVFDLAGSAPVATFSDIGTGSVPGQGSISLDPLFVSPSTGDYRLFPGSPCIDTGDNSVVPLDALDLAGYLRIWPRGGTVDMGCYEYESQAPGANHPPVAVALANGQAGIVVDEASPSGTAVTLDGSQSTDPDRGDVLTYAWDFTTDGPVDAGTAQAQATYAVGGPYTATLTVTDSHGLTSTDSVAVTVVPGEPDNQLDNLGKAITGGVTGGTIAPEIQGSLMAKVTAALTALAQNLPNDAKIAANNLKAFINEVRAQADVSVDIVNVAGRPVRTIWSHRGLLAGVNALLWDGRSAAGTKVPSGVYLVRIAAHGPRGSASHAVTTLRLTR